MGCETMTVRKDRQVSLPPVCRTWRGRATLRSHKLLKLRELCPCGRLLEVCRHAWNLERHVRNHLADSGENPSASNRVLLFGGHAAALRETGTGAIESFCFGRAADAF